MSLWQRAQLVARHEEVRRDDAVDVGVGRRREERAGRAGAFLVHLEGHLRRVGDAVLGAPALVLGVAGDDERGDADEGCGDGGASGGPAKAGRYVGGLAKAGHDERNEEEGRAGGRHGDVRVDERPIGGRRAGDEQGNAEREPGATQEQPHGAEPARRPTAAGRCQRDDSREREAENRMNRDLRVIPEGGRREARQVRRIEQQQQEPGEDQPRSQGPECHPQLTRSAKAGMYDTGGGARNNRKALVYPRGFAPRTPSQLSRAALPARAARGSLRALARRAGELVRDRIDTMAGRRPARRRPD